MTKEEAVLFDAISVYGKEAQLRMLQEEAAELIVAVSKLLRVEGEYISLEEAKFNALGGLAEEIADVEILIQQVKLMYEPISVPVENFRRAKIKRLADRLTKHLANNTNIDDWLDWSE